MRSLVIGAVIGAIVVGMFTQWHERTACFSVANPPDDATRRVSEECLRKAIGGDGWAIVRMDRPGGETGGTIFSLERPRIRLP